MLSYSSSRPAMYWRADWRGMAVSAIALLIGMAATSMSASAAAYTASNQTELLGAIASANADGDASSTITLTGNFTITGNTLPEVTKTLTIDIGANILTSDGPTTFNVGDGAELTVDGVMRVTGEPAYDTTAGRVFKTGAGTLNITGGPSNYSAYAEATTGAIVFKDGAQVTFNSVYNTDSLSNGHSSVTATGAGTVVRDSSGTTVSSRNGATLSVEAGAHYISSGPMSLGSTAGHSGTVNVRGDGSLVEGDLRIMRGVGYINVTEGGQFSSASTFVGGAGNSNTVLGDVGGTAHFLVSGDGSKWDSSNYIMLIRGSVDVLDGGMVNTNLMRLGISAGTGISDAAINVSGAGSQFNVASTAANAFQIAGGAGTGARSGALTIANGGKVTVGAGTGIVSLTTSAAGRAVLNIGGAEGQAATGAGTLAAGRVQFGAGTGIVNFNHTDATYGFDIELAGNGTINQIGSGKTVLTANQTAFTGQTNVRAGILAVNGILGGTMDVFGGRLQGNGTVGATTNHAGGMIAPGNSIGVLTVAGDYTSNGGGLEIESVLGGDGSPADLLLITGNSLLGLAPTLVSVVNLGGAGGSTTNGIKIVEVQGARSDANAFVLNGPAIGGAYRYDLLQHDVATGSDGAWYLRNSGELAPTVPTLENYPVALLGMIDLPTLRQRVGQSDANQQGIVTRIEGSAGHYQAASSTSGAAYDSSMYLAQIGLSGRLVDTADGSLTAGLTAQYSRHYASVFSAYGNGSNSTDGFGLGASLTWRGGQGTYVDLQGQIARFTTDLNAAGYSLVQGNGGTGFAAGIEAGHAFALDESWSVTPQAQLSYASVGFDKFTDRFGSEVLLNNGASLKGRLGLALDYQTEWQDAAGRAATTTLYGVTSLTYEFLDGANVAVSGTDLTFAGQKFGAELGLGGTLDWAGGAHALHGELLGSTSFQGSYAVKGTLGFTSRF